MGFQTFRRTIRLCEVKNSGKAGKRNFVSAVVTVKFCKRNKTTGVVNNFDSHTVTAMTTPVLLGDKNSEKIAKSGDL